MAVRIMQFCVLAYALVCTALTWATEPGDANWDRSVAMQAARSIDGSVTGDELLILTVSGSDQDTLQLLHQTESRQDWPLPAREQVLLKYTKALGTLPSDMVSPQVMAFLKNYRPRVLVAHDDHPEAGVPLFNISQIAHGVENRWRRQDASIEGQALISSNPDSLVDAYSIETHPAARRGYMDSLSQASQKQRYQVAVSAAERLPENPGLTGLTGHAALLAGDIDVLEKVLISGKGPDLSHLMRNSAQQLSAGDNAALLQMALEHAPTLTASLAIAELTPVAATQPGTQSMLLAQLGNPELGSAAALALAHHASPQTWSALRELAVDETHPLTAQRARMALDLGVEVQK